jgi:hypothetical protein
MESIKRIWRFVLQLSSVRAGILIFSMALLVRLAFILVFHPYDDRTWLELERVAVSLATTGVYGNPYAVPTGPSAHVSPGYTLILAAVIRLFGTGIPGEIAKELLASAVTSFQCAILPAVAVALYLDRRAGILAGFISALYPAKPMVQIAGKWEAPYTALFLMLVPVITVHLWKRHNLTPRNALVHGISWALAVLFASVLLPMFVVFVLLGVYFCRRNGIKPYLSFAALELLIVVACLTPWAVRNYVALGSPILTRSNFGLEMRISNNDLATPNERLNDMKGLYRMYHPLQSPEEAMKVRQMGEIAYNRRELEFAYQWIHAHPTRFLQLCLERFRWFWLFTDQTSWIKTLFLDTTVFLGLGGLIYVFQRQRLTGIVLAVVLLIYPLPNYLIHVGLRQRYPVDWILTLLSTSLVIGSLPKVQRIMPLKKDEGV